MIEVFIFLGILMFSIIAHEGGHFITAQMLGGKITDFSIGMGPAIKTIRRSNINYSLRCLPIGGYVASDVGHLRLRYKLIYFASGAIVNFLVYIFSFGMLPQYNFWLGTQKALIILPDTLYAFGQNLVKIGLSDIFSAQNSYFNQVAVGSTLVHDYGFWLTMAFVNFMFFFLNLLPIPPLDGSHMVLESVQAGLAKLGISKDRLEAMVKPLYLGGFIFMFAAFFLPLFFDGAQHLGISPWLYALITVGMAAIVIRYEKYKKQKSNT